MAIANEKRESDKGLENRLAKFSNKIGVIKVGRRPRTKVNALKYKIEDAVNATHAAFKGGVVAGVESLANLKTSSEIMNEAYRFLSVNLKTMSDSAPTGHLKTEKR